MLKETHEINQFACCWIMMRKKLNRLQTKNSREEGDKNMVEKY